MEPWVWSILLLFVALAIVALELFIPSGGVLGALSVLAVAGSIVLAFMSSVQFGMVMLIVTSILIPVVIGSALHWWPHTPLGRRILIQPPAHADDVLPQTAPYRTLKNLIGQRGVAKSKMLPSGIVLIDGRTYDAVSEGLPVDPGQTVQVMAVKMNRLEVRVVDASEPPQPHNEKPTDDLLSRPIDSLGLEPLDDPLA